MHKHMHIPRAANEFTKLAPQGSGPGGKASHGTLTLEDVRRTCEQLQYGYSYPRKEGGFRRTVYEAMGEAGVPQAKLESMYALFTHSEARKREMWLGVREDVEQARKKFGLRA